MRSPRRRAIDGKNGLRVRVLAIPEVDLRKLTLAVIATVQSMMFHESDKLSAVAIDFAPKPLEKKCR